MRRHDPPRARRVRATEINVGVSRTGVVVWLDGENVRMTTAGARRLADLLRWAVGPGRKARNAHTRGRSHAV